MNPDIEKKYQRLRSFFFGLCILAAGMLFLFSANNMLKSKAAEKWDVHEGVVTAEMRQRAGYFGGAWLQYAYEIDGNKYKGTLIGYGISRTQMNLEKGRRIRVYVNPADNNMAVLEVGIVKNHFIGLIFSVGFVWIGFVIWRRTA